MISHKVALKLGAVFVGFLCVFAPLRETNAASLTVAQIETSTPAVPPISPLLVSQSPGLGLLSPATSSGLPVFRPLVASDVPALPYLSSTLPGATTQLLFNGGGAPAAAAGITTPDGQSLNAACGGTQGYCLFGTMPTKANMYLFPTEPLFAGMTTTDTTSTYHIAMGATAEFDGTSASTTRVVGGRFVAVVGPASTANMSASTDSSGLRAGEFSVQHYGTGTLSLGFGTVSRISSYSTGAITDSASYYAFAPGVDAGTVWNSTSGFWVQGLPTAILGTITRYFGFRSDELAGGMDQCAVLTGIWGSCINDQSYFGAAPTFGSLSTGIGHLSSGGVLSSSPVNLAADVTGLLPNANLANTAVTVNGTTCTLGSSCSPIGAGAITAITGDGTATGPGSVALNITQAGGGTGTFTAGAFTTGPGGWIASGNGTAPVFSPSAGNTNFTPSFTPSGSATGSALFVRNSSVLTANGFLQLQASGATANLRTGLTGAGTPITTLGIGEGATTASLTQIDFQFNGVTQGSLSSAGLFTTASATFTGLASGGGLNYACFNSTGQLVSQVSPC